MNYIYDIILNFNDLFFEFYDWNKQDGIIQIKKIPIFKISSSDLYNIKNNKVCFDKSFIELIKNKTEYFSGKTIKLMNSVLLTDGLDIIALKIDKKIKYSSLQINDELDILEEIDIEQFKLNYKKLNKNNKNFLKTRYQIEQKNIIKKYLKNTFKEHNLSKIKYIYYECFNKKEDDISKIIVDFKNNIENKDIVFKINNILNKINI